MTRVERERLTVTRMIHLYCRHHEGNETLCGECDRLLEYALARLTACPFGDAKPTCRQCPVHCYRGEMRERMRAVMRYAGPRMIIHHPVSAIRHLLAEMK